MWKNTFKSMKGKQNPARCLLNIGLSLPFRDATWLVSNQPVWSYSRVPDLSELLGVHTSGLYAVCLSGRVDVCFVSFSYGLASLPLFHTPLSDVTVRCWALSVLLGLSKALLHNGSNETPKRRRNQGSAAPSAAPPGGCGSAPPSPSPPLSRDSGHGRGAGRD